MWRWVILGLFWFLACQKTIEDKPSIKQPIILGADLSLLPEIRSFSYQVFDHQGVALDMLDILKASGINTVRLRLWHTPQDNYASLSTVSLFAKELKKKGLNIILSIHLSDTWADPGSQLTPKAWQHLDFEALSDSLRAYLEKVTEAIPADMYQIGNEINHGFLWPLGSISQQENFLALYQTAAGVIRSKKPESAIILHLAGTNNVAWFIGTFEHLDFDILGLSYYPWWHGKDMDSIFSVWGEIHAQIYKPLLLVETAYPFTLEWNDWTHNVIGLEEQLIPSYPATAEGQKHFLMEIRKRCSLSDGWLGFCYWGGEWISYKGPQSLEGSSWENLALWDFHGRPLPAITVFRW